MTILVSGFTMLAFLQITMSCEIPSNLNPNANLLARLDSKTKNYKSR